MAMLRSSRRCAGRKPQIPFWRRAALRQKAFHEIAQDKTLAATSASNGRERAAYDLFGQAAIAIFADMERTFARWGGRDGSGPQETCGPKFSGYAVNAEPRPVTISIVQEPHNPPACAAYGSAFRDRVMGFAAEMHHASAVKRDHDGGDKDQLYHNARDSGQQRAREEHLPGERFA